MTVPRIGCHLSLGAKPEVSLADAARHGAECVQVFASSPAAWKPPLIDPVRDDSIVRASIDHGLGPLFIHGIYLINLASEDKILTRRSLSSIVGALEAAARMHAHGVIIHTGSHLGRGFDAVVPEVGRRIRQVLEQAPTGIALILENSAGSGGTIGSTLEELGQILDHVRWHPGVKIALDTAHLCGAGWDFHQADTPTLLAARLRDTLGFERLAAVHANDSKLPPGSKRDRHASVGEGFIGLDGFRNLLRESEFRAVPWICETPDLGSVEESERFGSVRRLLALRDSWREESRPDSTADAPGDRSDRVACVEQ